MIKAVVFDLDLTLYDRDASDSIAVSHYYDENPDLFAEGVTKEQARTEFLDACHAFIYEGWKAVLMALSEKGILTRIPEERPFVDWFMEQIHLFGVNYPFVVPMFAELREMGLKIGLITNGRYDYQHNKIIGLNLEKEFDEILIGSDPATAKPHPDLFVEMARRLDCAPNEMMYVGDNPLNDVDASRRVGYNAVWVRTLPPWRRPDIPRAEWEIDTVEEVPELVDQINAAMNGK